MKILYKLDALNNSTALGNLKCQFCLKFCFKKEIVFVFTFAQNFCEFLKIYRKKLLQKWTMNSRSEHVKHERK